MADDNETLNINIGSNPSGIETGSKAAAAAVNKVTKEANDLDRSFKQLRASLDPMYAAQLKYNEALAAFDRLLAEGRISEDQYAKSIARATLALEDQAKAQLKGTAVSREAMAAQKASASSRATSEDAANAAILASARTTAATRAADEARLTAQMAREEKARTAAALVEAKARAEAARAATLNIPVVNRNSQGRFIPAEVVAADRAAAAEEAANLLQVAQLEDTLAGQRVRNTQRIVTTREEAARRAQVADAAAADTATAAAAQTAEADAVAATSVAALAEAEEAAVAAAMAAATEQQSLDRALAEATALKAKAAAEAAVAEEKEAAATAAKAKADAEAAVQAKQAAKAEAEAAAAEESRVAAANRLRAAIDPLYAAQQKYNKSIMEANALAASGHIDETTRINATAAAEKNLSNALAGNTHAVGSNRAAYEGTVLIHEALQHRYSRMTGSLMILGQAMLGAGNSASLFGAILSPVGLAIGALVISLGALAVACYEGAVEQTKLQRSLEVTGQYAGVTAGQVEEAGRRIAKATDTSANQATASLETIVASGRVTGETLMTMGDIVQRLSVLTGKSSQEIAADMVKMADDPAAAMKKLNEQYHFLTPTQEEHIRNLIEEGNKTQAVAELSKSFDAALASEQTSLSGLAGWAHNAAVAMGNLWAAMKNIGKASTGVQRLQEIQQSLKEGDYANRNLDLFGLWAKKRQALIAEASGIEKKMGDDKIKTQRAQLGQQADDERAALDQLGMTTRTAHAKAQREMIAWRNEAKALLANPLASKEDKSDAAYRLSHAKETDAAINKRYDKGDMPAPMRKGPKGPSVVSRWNADLHSMEEASGNFFSGEDAKELAFWQSKLAHVKAGSAQYLAIQGKIFALQKKQARGSYQDDIAALKDKIDEEKGDVQGSEQAWQAYLNKVKSVMGATSKEYKEAAKEYRDAEREIAATQAKLMADAEKSKEQPLTRQYADTQTSEQMKSSDVDYAAQQGLISDKKLAEAHKALLAEELQDEIDYENRISAMRIEDLQKQLLIPNLAKDKIAEIQAEIVQLTQEHENKLNQIRNKGLIEYQKINQQIATATMQRWMDTADAITGSLTSGFKSALQNGFNLRKGMIDLANSIANVWIDSAGKMLNAWIRSLFQQKAVTAATTAAQTTIHVAGETTKTAATVTGATIRTATEVSANATTTASSAMSALAQIAHAAGVAAARVYASIAAIPYVGPFLAPAAAAAALAAVVMIGKSLFSAEGGQVEVGEDGQLTELHKKEMVLPAWAADPLRKQLRSGSSSGVIGAAATAGETARKSIVNSGDVHLHYGPQYGPVPQSQDMATLLRQDGDRLLRYLKRKQRDGHFNAGGGLR